MVHFFFRKTFTPLNYKPPKSGESELRLAALFDHARRAAPTVVVVEHLEELLPSATRRFLTKNPTTPASSPSVRELLRHLRGPGT